MVRQCFGECYSSLWAVKEAEHPLQKLSGTDVRQFQAGFLPFFEVGWNPRQASQADREEYDNLGTIFFKIYQVAPEIQIFEDACKNHLFGPKTSKYTYWYDL